MKSSPIIFDLNLKVLLQTIYGTINKIMTPFLRLVASYIIKLTAYPSGYTATHNLQEPGLILSGECASFAFKTM